MKKIVPIIFLSIGLISTGCSRVAPNEEEDVRAAVNELYSAINARDADTFLKYMGPDGYTEFSYDGSPLLTVTEGRVRNNFSSEFRSNFEVQEMRVKVYKNAAIVTGYRVGTLVRPDGTGHLINKLSLSMMWYQQEGKWKLAHVHLSPSNPLVGVWKVIETAIIDANGNSKTSYEHPSVYIFQDDYYCMVMIQGDEPRTEFENPWNPTEEEIIKAYKSFLVNAGTYELKDSIMTTYPTIARVPNFVGGSASYECKIEGDTLELMMFDEVSKNGIPQPWVGKSKYLRTLIRVR